MYAGYYSVRHLIQRNRTQMQGRGEDAGCYIRRSKRQKPLTTQLGLSLDHNTLHLHVLFKRNGDEELLVHILVGFNQTS